MKSSAAPNPRLARRDDVSSEPKRPTEVRVTPTANTMEPKMMRRLRFSGVAALPSRSAASAGIRWLTSAGIRAEPTVTPMPSTNTMITVRGSKMSGPSGNSPPPAENRNFRNAEIPMPPNRPMIDAATPTSRASISTMPVSCRPVMPMLRSNPNCCTRWLIRMANVL